MPFAPTDIAGLKLWVKADSGGLRQRSASGTVTAITVSANIGTCTTSAAHGMVSGNSVAIAGNTAVPDGTYTISTTPLTTTFTFAVVTGNGTQSGGTWTDVTPASADADPVGYWPDQSGQANHLTQATAGFRPLYKTAIQNGLPVLRLDGSDDRMETASLLGSALFGAQAATVFAVQKQTGSNANNTTICWESTASTNRALIHATYSDVIYFDYPSDSGGRTSVAQPGGWDDAWQTLCCVRGTVTSSIYARSVSLATGTPAGSLDTAASNVLVAGAYRSAANSTYSIFFQGDIGELLIYNTALSDADRQSVESYLNARWAVYTPAGSLYRHGNLSGIGSGGRLYQNPVG